MLMMFVFCLFLLSLLWPPGPLPDPASTGPCFLVVLISTGELTEHTLKRETSFRNFCILIGNCGVSQRHSRPKRLWLAGEFQAYSQIAIATFGG